jgi:microsomal dipeptidase-like Zn-dependent dipeptidase
MIADLHAHYPMHLDPGIRGNLLALLRTRAGRLRLRDHLRALGVNLASQFANYPGLFAGERVRIEWMAEGGVGVACSVLYSFFDEVDSDPPARGEYTAELLRQADLVEERVRGTAAVVARTPAELDAAAGRVALVHCVEGGFHLLGGDDPADVGRAVDALADRGVAYITLAHLLYRGVATGANAFPFLDDDQFARRCKQPPVGLTARGRAAVEAMVRRRVMVDVAHMSERALADTFALLDELDPQRRVPVLASHGGYRFGTQAYQLAPETIARIAERDGVVGLIFAQHQIWDGLEKARFPRLARHFEGFDGTFAKLCAHIDAIHDVTGDHRHIGIGSDFDGFIKPTLKGLRDMRDMRRLETRLREKYGDEAAAAMCAENALRPLRTYWAGAAAGAQRRE